MQVDGFLGVTAGITEMLLQSHEGVIDFLPALPKEWSKGNFEGVRARGGFELSFQWKNNKLFHAIILSKAGGICKLNLPSNVKGTSNGKEVTIQVQSDGSISFPTQKGENYEVINQ